MLLAVFFGCVATLMVAAPVAAARGQGPLAGFVSGCGVLVTVWMGSLGLIMTFLALGLLGNGAALALVNAGMVALLASWMHASVAGVRPRNGALTTALYAVPLLAVAALFGAGLLPGVIAFWAALTVLLGGFAIAAGGGLAVGVEARRREWLDAASLVELENAVRAFEELEAALRGRTSSGESPAARQLAATALSNVNLAMAEARETARLAARLRADGRWGSTIRSMDEARRVPPPAGMGAVPYVRRMRAVEDHLVSLARRREEIESARTALGVAAPVAGAGRAGVGKGASDDLALAIERKTLEDGWAALTATRDRVLATYRAAGRLETDMLTPEVEGVVTSCAALRDRGTAVLDELGRTPTGSPAAAGLRAELGRLRQALATAGDGLASAADASVDSTYDANRPGPEDDDLARGLRRLEDARRNAAAARDRMREW